VVEFLLRMTLQERHKVVYSGEELIKCEDSHTSNPISLQLKTFSHGMSVQFTRLALSRVPGRIIESTRPQLRPPNTGFSRSGVRSTFKNRVGAGANLSFWAPGLPGLPLLL
jgi:hypothetical protein